MFNFDLLNLFEGLVRNYGSFKLNEGSSKFDIIKKETNYFLSVGEFLGYSSMIKGIDGNEEDTNGNSEIFWRRYDDEKSIPKELVFYFRREEDLAKDVTAIQGLFSVMSEEKECSSFMQMLQVSSRDRITYLNKLIQSSKVLIKKDLLVIYKVRNVLDKKTYLYAYLFSGNIIIRESVATSYIDIFGNIKTKFKK